MNVSNSLLKKIPRRVKKAEVTTKPLSKPWRVMEVERGITKIDDLPGIAQSTEKAEDWVIACGVVSKSETVVEERRLDREKKTVLEEVEQKKRVITGTLEGDKERWMEAICERVVKEMEDGNVPYVERQHFYNTKTKFNRLLKNVAKDIHYHLK